MQQQCRQCSGASKEAVMSCSLACLEQCLRRYQLFFRSKMSQRSAKLRHRSHGGRSGHVTQTQTKLAGSMNRILASSKGSTKTSILWLVLPYFYCYWQTCDDWKCPSQRCEAGWNIASSNSSYSYQAKTAAARNQQAKRKASALDAEIEML